VYKENDVQNGTRPPWLCQRSRRRGHRLPMSWPIATGAFTTSRPCTAVYSTAGRKQLWVSAAAVAWVLRRLRLARRDGTAADAQLRRSIVVRIPAAASAAWTLHERPFRGRRLHPSWFPKPNLSFSRNRRRVVETGWETTGNDGYSTH